jgi:hypothetical protein
MTKLSRAVIACISAIMMLLGAASIAGADTFTTGTHDDCLCATLRTLSAGIAIASSRPSNKTAITSPLNSSLL